MPVNLQLCFIMNAYLVLISAIRITMMSFEEDVESLLLQRSPVQCTYNSRLKS